MGWKPWVCGAKAHQPPTSPHTKRNMNTPKSKILSTSHVLKNEEIAVASSPSHSQQYKIEQIKNNENMNNKITVIEHVQHDHWKHSTPTVITNNTPSPNPTVNSTTPKNQSAPSTPMAKIPSPTITSQPSSPSSHKANETEKPKVPFSRFDAVAPMAPTVDYFHKRNLKRAAATNPQQQHPQKPTISSSSSPSVPSSTLSHQPIHSNSNSIYKIELNMDPDYEDEVAESAHIPVHYI